MLVVILLDWNHPWLWIRQLRDWIRVLRSLIVSLDDASKAVLEENIAILQDKGRNLGGEGNTSMENVKIPLGPGEWDEPLGIPLCVVCQNADKIESLEKERGWKEEEFDFILQYLRTILLKHGASLIYTMPSAPGSLQTLVHSTLGIKSLLKQEQLRHNVTDRDRVLVPPNWDSWAKIRILRGNFEVEEISEKWSIDIDVPQGPAQTSGQTSAIDDETSSMDGPASPTGSQDAENSATAIYEKEIRNPESDFTLSTLSKQGNGIEVTSMDPQAFLTEQVHVLDQLRQEDDKDAALKAARKETDPSARNWVAAGTGGEDTSGVVEEHIGPVQFNMGGIHVNADEMVKRLQVRDVTPLMTIRRGCVRDSCKDKTDIKTGSRSKPLQRAYSIIPRRTGSQHHEQRQAHVILLRSDQQRRQQPTGLLGRRNGCHLQHLIAIIPAHVLPSYASIIAPVLIFHGTDVLSTWLYTHSVVCLATVSVIFESPCNTLTVSTSPFQLHLVT
jgi:dynein light intermediate chain 1